MTALSGNQLYDDPQLAQFYDLAHRQRDDFDYCRTLAKDARSVLDLGCGTGELAVDLAVDLKTGVSTGRTVTGVDPAAAMLDIARARPGGDKVKWVQADACFLQLPERFDLVVLTGHAFQVFLEPGHQRAALSTFAAHLTPTGRFIFDSRNPDFPAPKERFRHDNTQMFDHPEFGPIETWNSSTYDERTGILSYENSYRVLKTGKSFSAPAQIRYTPQPQLATMTADAGLRADEWLGDWQGNPFHDKSREIIPIGRLA